MTKHPVPEIQEQANSLVDSMGELQPWQAAQEYRDAYARLCGLADDNPKPAEPQLQVYLTDLDKKIRKLMALRPREV